MPKEPAPIVIVPYNLEWVDAYNNEAACIREAIGDYLTDLEHIGSTSVPGLAAKPIIDILGGLKSLADTPLIVPLLAELGYTYHPEFETDLPERRYFNKHIGGLKPFHLHMVEPETTFFRRHLAFRNYLRLHPDAAAEYASLKIALAGQFGSDREGYTNAKTEFILNIEHKAMKMNE
jgi:GrpB-like predicted nucleotidyltransferase (UPF0157 family)